MDRLKNQSSVGIRQVHRRATYLIMDGIQRAEEIKALPRLSPLLESRQKRKSSVFSSAPRSDDDSPEIARQSNNSIMMDSSRTPSPTRLLPDSNDDNTFVTKHEGRFYLTRELRSESGATLTAHEVAKLIDARKKLKRQKPKCLCRIDESNSQSCVDGIDEKSQPADNRWQYHRRGRHRKDTSTPRSTPQLEDASDKPEGKKGPSVVVLPDCPIESLADGVNLSMVLRVTKPSGMRRDIQISMDMPSYEVHTIEVDGREFVPRDRTNYV